MYNYNHIKTEVRIVLNNNEVNIRKEKQEYSSRTRKALLLILTKLRQILGVKGWLIANIFTIIQ